MSAHREALRWNSDEALEAASSFGNTPKLSLKSQTPIEQGVTHPPQAPCNVDIPGISSSSSTHMHIPANISIVPPIVSQTPSGSSESYTGPSESPFNMGLFPTSSGASWSQYNSYEPDAADLHLLTETHLGCIAGGEPLDAHNTNPLDSTNYPNIAPMDSDAIQPQSRTTDIAHPPPFSPVHEVPPAAGAVSPQSCSAPSPLQSLQDKLATIADAHPRSQRHSEPARDTTAPDVRHVALVSKRDADADGGFTSASLCCSMDDAAARSESRSRHTSIPSDSSSHICSGPSTLALTPDCPPTYPHTHGGRGSSAASRSRGGSTDDGVSGASRGSFSQFLQRMSPFTSLVEALDSSDEETMDRGRRRERRVPRNVHSVTIVTHTHADAEPEDTDELLVSPADGADAAATGSAVGSASESDEAVAAGAARDIELEVLGSRRGSAASGRMARSSRPATPLLAPSSADSHEVPVYVDPAAEDAKEQGGATDKPLRVLTHPVPMRQRARVSVLTSTTAPPPQPQLYLPSAGLQCLPSPAAAAAAAATARQLDPSSALAALLAPPATTPATHTPSATTEVPPLLLPSQHALRLVLPLAVPVATALAHLPAWMELGAHSGLDVTSVLAQLHATAQQSPAASPPALMSSTPASPPSQPSATPSLASSLSVGRDLVNAAPSTAPFLLYQQRLFLSPASALYRCLYEATAYPEPPDTCSGVPLHPQITSLSVRKLPPPSASLQSSAHALVQLTPATVPLPHFLTPAALEVTDREEDVLGSGYQHGTSLVRGGVRGGARVGSVAPECRGDECGSTYLYSHGIPHPYNAALAATARYVAPPTSPCPAGVLGSLSARVEALVCARTGLCNGGANGIDIEAEARGHRRKRVRARIQTVLSRVSSPAAHDDSHHATTTSAGADGADIAAPLAALVERVHAHACVANKYLSAVCSGQWDLRSEELCSADGEAGSLDDAGRPDAAVGNDGSRHRRKRKAARTGCGAVSPHRAHAHSAAASAPSPFARAVPLLTPSLLPPLPRLLKHPSAVAQALGCASTGPFGATATAPAGRGGATPSAAAGSSAGDAATEGGVWESLSELGSLGRAGIDVIVCKLRRGANDSAGMPVPSPPPEEGSASVALSTFSHTYVNTAETGRKPLSSPFGSASFSYPLPSSSEQSALRQLADLATLVPAVFLKPTLGASIAHEPLPSLPPSVVALPSPFTAMQRCLAAPPGTAPTTPQLPSPAAVAHFAHELLLCQSRDEHLSSPLPHDTQRFHRRSLHSNPFASAVRALARNTAPPAQDASSATPSPTAADYLSNSAESVVASSATDTRRPVPERCRSNSGSGDGASTSLPAAVTDRVKSAAMEAKSSLLRGVRELFNPAKKGDSQRPREATLMGGAMSALRRCASGLGTPSPSSMSQLTNLRSQQAALPPHNAEIASYLVHLRSAYAAGLLQGQLYECRVFELYARAVLASVRVYTAAVYRCCYHLIQTAACCAQPGLARALHLLCACTCASLRLCAERWQAQVAMARGRLAALRCIAEDIDEGVYSPVAMAVPPADGGSSGSAGGDGVGDGVYGRLADGKVHELTHLDARDRASSLDATQVTLSSSALVLATPLSAEAIRVWSSDRHRHAHTQLQVLLAQALALVRMCAASEGEEGLASALRVGEDVQGRYRAGQLLRVRRREDEERLRRQRQYARGSVYSGAGTGADGYGLMGGYTGYHGHRGSMPGSAGQHSAPTFSAAHTTCYGHTRDSAATTTAGNDMNADLALAAVLRDEALRVGAVLGPAGIVSSFTSLLAAPLGSPHPSAGAEHSSAVQSRDPPAAALARDVCPTDEALDSLRSFEADEESEGAADVCVWVGSEGVRAMEEEVPAMMVWGSACAAADTMDLALDATLDSRRESSPSHAQPPSAPTPPPSLAPPTAIHPRAAAKTCAVATPPTPTTMPAGKRTSAPSTPAGPSPAVAAALPTSPSPTDTHALRRSTLLAMLTSASLIGRRHRILLAHLRHLLWRTLTQASADAVYRRDHTYTAARRSVAELLRSARLAENADVRAAVRAARQASCAPTHAHASVADMGDSAAARAHTHASLSYCAGHDVLLLAKVVRVPPSQTHDDVDVDTLRTEANEEEVEEGEEGDVEEDVDENGSLYGADADADEEALTEAAFRRLPPPPWLTPLCILDPSLPAAYLDTARARTYMHTPHLLSSPLLIIPGLLPPLPLPMPPSSTTLTHIHQQYLPSFSALLFATPPALAARARAAMVAWLTRLLAVYLQACAAQRIRCTRNLAGDNGMLARVAAATRVHTQTPALQYDETDTLPYVAHQSVLPLGMPADALEDGCGWAGMEVGVGLDSADVARTVECTCGQPPLTLPLPLSCMWLWLHACREVRERDAAGDTPHALSTSEAEADELLPVPMLSLASLLAHAEEHTVVWAARAMGADTATNATVFSSSICLSSPSLDVASADARHRNSPRAYVLAMSGGRGMESECARLLHSVVCHCASAETAIALSSPALPTTPQLRRALDAVHCGFRVDAGVLSALEACVEAAIDSLMQRATHLAAQPEGPTATAVGHVDAEDGYLLFSASPQDDVSATSDAHVHVADHVGGDDTHMSVVLTNVTPTSPCSPALALSLPAVPARVSSADADVLMVEAPQPALLGGATSHVPANGDAQALLTVLGRCGVRTAAVQPARWVQQQWLPALARVLAAAEVRGDREQRAAAAAAVEEEWLALEREAETAAERDEDDMEQGETGMDADSSQAIPEYALHAPALVGAEDGGALSLDDFLNSDSDDDGHRGKAENAFTAEAVAENHLSTTSPTPTVLVYLDPCSLPQLPLPSMMSPSDAALTLFAMLPLPLPYFPLALHRSQQRPRATPAADRVSGSDLLHEEGGHATAGRGTSASTPSVYACDETADSVLPPATRADTTTTVSLPAAPLASQALRLLALRRHRLLRRVAHEYVHRNTWGLPKRAARDGGVASSASGPAAALPAGLRGALVDATERTLDQLCVPMGAVHAAHGDGHWARYALQRMFPTHFPPVPAQPDFAAFARDILGALAPESDPADSSARELSTARNAPPRDYVDALKMFYTAYYAATSHHAHLPQPPAVPLTLFALALLSGRAAAIAAAQLAGEEAAAATRARHDATHVDALRQEARAAEERARAAAAAIRECEEKAREEEERRAAVRRQGIQVAQPLSPRSPYLQPPTTTAALPPAQASASSPSLPALTTTTPGSPVSDPSASSPADSLAPPARSPPRPLSIPVPPIVPDAPPGYMPPFSPPVPAASSTHAPSPPAPPSPLFPASVPFANSLNILCTDGTLRDQPPAQPQPFHPDYLLSPPPPTPLPVPSPTLSSNAPSNASPVSTTSTSPAASSSYSSYAVYSAYTQSSASAANGSAPTPPASVAVPVLPAPTDTPVAPEPLPLSASLVGMVVTSVLLEDVVSSGDATAAAASIWLPHDPARASIIADHMARERGAGPSAGADVWAGPGSADVLANAQMAAGLATGTSGPRGVAVYGAYDAYSGYTRAGTGEAAGIDVQPTVESPERTTAHDTLRAAVAIAAAQQADAQHSAVASSVSPASPAAHAPGADTPFHAHPQAAALPTPAMPLPDPPLRHTAHATYSAYSTYRAHLQPPQPAPGTAADAMPRPEPLVDVYGMYSAPTRTPAAMATSLPLPPPPTTTPAPIAPLPTVYRHPLVVDILAMDDQGAADAANGDATTAPFTIPPFLALSLSPLLTTLPAFFPLPPPTPVALDLLSRAIGTPHALACLLHAPVTNIPYSLALSSSTTVPVLSPPRARAPALSFLALAHAEATVASVRAYDVDAGEGPGTLPHPHPFASSSLSMSAPALSHTPALRLTHRLFPAALAAGVLANAHAHGLIPPALALSPSDADSAPLAALPAVLTCALRVAHAYDATRRRARRFKGTSTRLVLPQHTSLVLSPALISRWEFSFSHSFFLTLFSQWLCSLLHAEGRALALWQWRCDHTAGRAMEEVVCEGMRFNAASGLYVAVAEREEDVEDEEAEAVSVSAPAAKDPVTAVPVVPVAVAPQEPATEPTLGTPTTSGVGEIGAVASQPLSADGHAPQPPSLPSPLSAASPLSSVSSGDVPHSMPQWPGPSSPVALRACLHKEDAQQRHVLQQVLCYLLELDGHETAQTAVLAEEQVHRMYVVSSHAEHTHGSAQTRLPTQLSQRLTFDPTNPVVATDVVVTALAGLAEEISSRHNLSQGYARVLSSALGRVVAARALRSTCVSRSVFTGSVAMLTAVCHALHTRLYCTSASQLATHVHAVVAAQQDAGVSTEHMYALPLSLCSCVLDGSVDIACAQDNAADNGVSLLRQSAVAAHELHQRVDAVLNVHGVRASQRLPSLTTLLCAVLRRPLAVAVRLTLQQRWLRALPVAAFDASAKYLPRGFQGMRRYWWCTDSHAHARTCANAAWPHAVGASALPATSTASTRRLLCVPLCLHECLAQTHASLLVVDDDEPYVNHTAGDNTAVPPLRVHPYLPVVQLLSSIAALSAPTDVVATLVAAAKMLQACMRAYALLSRAQEDEWLALGAWAEAALVRCPLHSPVTDAYATPESPLTRAAACTCVTDTVPTPHASTTNQPAAQDPFASTCSAHILSPLTQRNVYAIIRRCVAHACSQGYQPPFDVVATRDGVMMEAEIDHALDSTVSSPNMTHMDVVREAALNAEQVTYRVVWLEDEDSALKNVESRCEIAHDEPLISETRLSQKTWKYNNHYNPLRGHIRRLKRGALMNQYPARGCPLRSPPPSSNATIGADDFMPLWIYTWCFVDNMEAILPRIELLKSYIAENNFGEESYYYTCTETALSFILEEGLDEYVEYFN